MNDVDGCGYSGPVSDLTPAELRVLDAVAREGSFSAAANALGLTQSAVSHAVRVIERKIGAVLFDRGRTGARPTPAGERAVLHARGVLRLLDVLHADALAAAGSAVSSSLRVAAFRSAAAHLLPAALSRLTAQHPGVSCDVVIVRDVGPGTAGEVVAGRADLALVNLPHHLPDAAGTRLVTGTLLTEPYVLIHPVGAADPRRLPLLNWDENCSGATRRWFAGQDWLPPATIQVADDSVLLSMVAHGMGMAVVPRITAAGAAPGVAVRDLGPDAPTGTIGYVTTVELSRATAVRALVRELRAGRPMPPAEAA
jgi:DNA-binding transcriptional LysR family regulator